MNHFSAFWTRLFALTRKESKQLLRDKSSMAIGFILPIITPISTLNKAFQL